MLTYHFDSHAKMPMYEYLYNCIKDDIIHEKIKPHEKVPSKRALAKHLQISLITVENAYNQLLIEGYIYSIEKKGYFVNEIQFPSVPVIKKEIEIIDQQPQYLMDLKTNSVSPDDFPFSTWSKLTRQVLSKQNASLLVKPPQEGCYELRKAICDHLYSFSGMSVSPYQIIVGAGTEYLYNLVIQLFSHNSIYAFENPGHKSISKVYETNRIPCLHISLDQDGLNINELRNSSANIVHISPAHHYPTGITMPIKRRLEILKWANDRNGYIIEDDYDSEFRLRGKPISTLFQIDQNERVIYMNTFSKTLAPSFRMSYMVLPLHLVKRFHDKLHFYSCSVSSLEQVILASFIEQGYFERHINRMRNAYKDIRDELLKEIYHSPMSSSVEITEENAGLHFLLHYQGDYDDHELIEKAKSIGLNIAALSEYYQNPFSTHTLVINYSGLTKKDIPLAVQLLNQLFDYS